MLARACGSGRAILFLVYQEVSSVHKKIKTILQYIDTDMIPKIYWFWDQYWATPHQNVNNIFIVLINKIQNYRLEIKIFKVTIWPTKNEIPFHPLKYAYYLILRSIQYSANAINRKCSYNVRKYNRNIIKPGGVYLMTFLTVFVFQTNHNLMDIISKTRTT